MIVAVCLAAAVSAEPEPFYGYGYGYGLGLHQQHWPAARAPGFSSTCYGCRAPGLHYLGKRSADAEPHLGYGLGFYGYHPYAFGYRAALPAVATAAGPTGVAGHPGAATSFVARSPQGLRGKRSAEPYYGYGGYYGYPGYGLGYRGFGYRGFGYGGVAGHPTGTSFVARSPQGLGK